MTDKANPKSGCLTTVVRRLLCSGSQQTHPSDNIPDAEPLDIHYEFEEDIKKDPDAENDDVSLQPSSSSVAPNVVAKLMGLDGVPEMNRIRYDDGSGTVTRSKSVNFMDYILRVDEEEEEEEDDKDGQRRRRVKASVSFREILPSSARSKSNSQKRHDFLLLYLDKLDENREIGSSRSRRFEKVVIEDPKPKEVEVVAEKKENKKVSKKFKDEPRKAVKKKKSEKRSDVGAKKVSWFLSPSKNKSKSSLIGEVSVPAEKENGYLACDETGSKRVAGKEGQSPESYSEKSNSSPVSVLDRDLYDYLILDDDYYSGESETTLESKTEERSSPTKTKSNKKESNGQNDEESEFIAKLMNMLSELSEEDMKSSAWVSCPTDPIAFHHVEDLCDDFGQEILDLIMDQFVDELCI